MCRVLDWNANPLGLILSTMKERKRGKEGRREKVRD
jgi:hypothetical protein